MNAKLFVWLVVVPVVAVVSAQVPASGGQVVGGQCGRWYRGTQCPDCSSKPPPPPDGRQCGKCGRRYRGAQCPHCAKPPPPPQDEAKKKGLAAFKQRDWAAAIRHLAEALRLAPQDQVVRSHLRKARAMAAYGKGVAAERRGDLTAAVALLEEALSHAPDDKAVQDRLAAVRKALAAEKDEAITTEVDRRVAAERHGREAAIAKAKERIKADIAALAPPPPAGAGRSRQGALAPLKPAGSGGDGPPAVDLSGAGRGTLDPQFTTSGQRRAAGTGAPPETLATADAFQRLGGYKWGGGAHGVPGDIVFKGEKIREADGKKTTHCSGFTFAVAMRAAGKKDILRDKSLAQVQRFSRQWYGDATGITGAAQREAVRKKTCVAAMVNLGIGREIDAGRKAQDKDVLPGDFVQLWRTGGSGHCVVFRAWVRNDKGAIVGLRYRSSNKEKKTRDGRVTHPGGIGDRVEHFAGSGGAVDPKQFHVGRLSPRPLAPDRIKVLP